MKKNLLIILFFLGQNVFGQEYQFDKAFTYEEKRSKFSHSFTEIFMTNNSNSNYYVMMITTSKSNGSGLKTYVYDLDTKLVHYFFTTKISDKIEYKYLYSMNLIDNKCYNSLNLFELKESLINDKTDKVVINKYNNTTEKKVTEFCEIDLIPTDNINLKPFLRRFYENLNCCELLKLPKNYIPKKVTIQYEDGSSNSVKHIATDEVSYSISLNKDKIKINN